MLLEEKNCQDAKVYACQEDLKARAIRSREKVTVPDNFYTALMEDVMKHCERVYTF